MTGEILPEWVSTILTQWKMRKRTGSLKLNYYEGGIRNIERVEIDYPNKRRAANAMRREEKKR